MALSRTKKVIKFRNKRVKANGMETKHAIGHNRVHDACREKKTNQIPQNNKGNENGSYHIYSKNKIYP